MTNIYRNDHKASVKRKKFRFINIWIKNIYSDAVIFLLFLRHSANETVKSVSSNFSLYKKVIKKFY